MTFQVPRSWLDWYNKFHNNLRLTSRELRGAESGEGEWDTEYAQVINSAVPFQHCVAHVGGEGWGAEGASFADTQLRVYVTPQTISELVSAIANTGLATARSIAPTAASYKDEGVSREWRNVNLSYSLRYGDYGGTANARFYLRRVNDQTLVMVFMGGEQQEIDEVLKSVIVN